MEENILNYEEYIHLNYPGKTNKTKIKRRSPQIGLILVKKIMKTIRSSVSAERIKYNLFCKTQAQSFTPKRAFLVF